MGVTTLLLTFAAISNSFNLPEGLLSALCYVESNHKVYAMHMDDGGSASIGICQIKLSTARLMGFKGSQKQLKEPINNIYYAAKYLSYQLDRYDDNVQKAVAAYNAGTCRIKNGKIRNKRYVNKVTLAWREKR